MLEAEDGTVLAAHGEAIGVATNNVAEYSALIAGLEKAVELHVRELGSVTYTAVRREHNKLADQLVNEALDAAK